MCVSESSRLIKLIDFGLARKINADITIKAMMGTAEYVSPEVVNYDPISLASDMWSLGVICYIM